MKGVKTSLLFAAATSVSVNCAWAAGPVAYVAAAKSERAAEVADCLARAKQLCQKFKYRDAFVYFNRAIALDPKNPTLYQERAVADEMLRSSRDAIKDYDTMLQLNPRSVVGYLSRANVKNGLHDYRGAIADDNIAIGLNPKNALAYNNRGIDRYETGDYHGAIQDFSHALKLGSKEDSWSYWWRGNARDKLGDHRGAIDDLTVAIKLDPDYALPYGDRARVRADLGDKAGALSDLEKALATPQGFAYPHLQRQMADLLSSMGNSKQAVGYYDNVYELHDDISSVYARGTQNALCGNFAAAAGDYCRAISKSFGLLIRDLSEVFRLLVAGKFSDANSCLGCGLKEFSDTRYAGRFELMRVKAEVLEVRREDLLAASPDKQKDHPE